jgi:RHS repeat-associated protein
MPRWWVSEPYVNVWVADEPLSYFTSDGQRMSFRFTHSQRARPGAEWSYRDWKNPHYVVTRYWDTSRSVADVIMTNAAWSHTWWSEIVFWDTHLETNAPAQPTFDPPLAPTNAYYEFSTAYEAAIYPGEGGVVYFNWGSETTPNGVSKLQLEVIGRSPEGGPKVPVREGGIPLPYPSTGAVWVDEPLYGFRVKHPDGSQDIYGFVWLVGNKSACPYRGDDPRCAAPNSARDYTARAYLTQRIDAQGRVTRLGYEKGEAALGQPPYNLRWVVDSDGRTNTYSYNPTNRNQLVQIQDAYGRTASFGYDYSSKLLTSIVDAAGQTNTFGYAITATPHLVYCSDGTNSWVCGTNWSQGAATGWLESYTTRYGTNRFAYYQAQEQGATDEYMRRAVLVTEPNGGRQLFYYRHRNEDVMGGTASPVPDVPGATFDAGSGNTQHPALYYRNTFHWDARQFAALSGQNWADLAGALGNLTANDYRKAQLKHWLLGADEFTVSECVSGEREPSPDASGTGEGARVWYDYAGKPAGKPEVEGSEPLVSCVARVLADGTTHYTQTDYTVMGYARRTRESHTTAGGGVGVRTNSYGYSANGMDLTRITNGTQRLLSLAYHANRTLAFVTNALNEPTELGYWSGTPKLGTVRWPGGLTASLNYYASNALSPNGGFPQTLQWTNVGRALTFTWTNGLPHTVSDERGLSVTNTWDGLNRLTRTTYPDGSYTSNWFDKLDLIGARDRLGHWTWYSYDALQRLRTITDARSNVTTLTWCDCGGLESVTDPLANTTTLFYNNQGRLTGVQFPDDRSLAYHYDTAGRLTNVLDGLNRSVKLGWNNQGLLTTVSNAYGPVWRVVYDALNRPEQVTDANNVTVTNTFDLLNRLTARTWPDAVGEGYRWSANGLLAHTNRNQQVTRFTRNAAGWLLGVTNANEEVTAFGYNTLGLVTDLWDGNTNRTQWSYDEYGRATSKLNALAQEVRRWSYDPNGNLTNRWTPQFGDTTYTYDAAGNLTNIVYPAGTGSTPSLSFTYDALNRLTNAVDAVGTTRFSYTAAGQLQSEDGPWNDDAISHGYTQGQRTGTTLAQPGDDWLQQYAYDNASRLQTLTSPAGTFGYLYPASGFRPLPSGIALPNAAWITNHYDSLARLDYTALINRWGHVLDAYAYTHDPLGLRTNVVRDLGWTTNSVAVGYDAIGQLTGWTGRESDGTARLNEQLRYVYDGAGNLRHRTNNALAQTFGNNTINELTSVSRAGNLTVSGNTPAPAASVMVNGQPAQTYADFTFASTNHALVGGNNTFTNIAENVYGLKTTNVVSAYLPAPCSLLYDLNGNLTNDGLRNFAYDADNQLVTNWVANAWKQEFVYDAFGRKRIERTYGWQGGQWTKTNETRYVYDGMLAVQERNASNEPLVTYTRGLDLNGTRQGAGGIGGLLARTDAGGSAFYHADGAGNITALMDAQNNIVARYLYDAFGRQVGQWGPLAEANRYRFSSKEVQPHSGLYYYGFRFYDPSLQRWLNQDPLGERGGMNLYGFVGNSPLNRVDPFGLSAESAGIPGFGNFMRAGQDFFADLFFPFFYEAPPLRPGEMPETITLQGEPSTLDLMLLGGSILAPELLGLKMPGKSPPAELLPSKGPITSPCSPAAKGTTLGLDAATTWGRAETLADHFARHGGDFAAKTADDYASMASRFFQESQAAKLPTKIDSQGVIRVFDPKTGTFGSFNPNGTTRTLFKPSSPTYFDRQPGTLVP